MKTSLRATPMSEATDDVRRALTIVFRKDRWVGPSRCGTHVLLRHGVGWSARGSKSWTPSCSAGWLKAQNGKTCASRLRLAVDVPFGWFPTDPPLVEPVSATASSSGAAAPVEHERTAAGPPPKRSTSCSITTATGRHRRRPKSEAHQACGEVHFKTERPRRWTNCNGVPEDPRVPSHRPWMAYALVKSIEQGLVMDDIVKALDVN